jgi:hypothetical protein
MREIRVTDPVTGGQKGTKPERFDLIPFDALEEVARVYGYGATKYDEDNWLKGYKWRLSAAALIRHVARFMLGEDRDPETGLLHTAHAAWHCLTLCTFTLRRLGTDDRRPPIDPPCVPADPFPHGSLVVVSRRDSPLDGEEARVVGKEGSHWVVRLQAFNGYLALAESDLRRAA